MENLRRNEFVDLMEINEIMFDEKEHSIAADIPTIGSVTYYPKKNRLNVHRGNEWHDDGFHFVKCVIHCSKKNIHHLARNIVNQLFDLAEVSVEKRQSINDQADLFVKITVSNFINE